MARHIISVKINPEAPTIEPTTTSNRSLTANPATEPAIPESEFKSEIVMGISAPPTRTVKSTPKSNEQSASNNEQAVKAEALARQGNAGEAAIVLKEFKQSRYTKAIEIPSGADEVLKEILNERLLEFYMENDMRWLDMKRLGVSMQRVIAGEKFTLEPHDFRYTFPIPEKEMALNKNMVQNPGWENILQN